MIVSISTPRKRLSEDALEATVFESGSRWQRYEESTTGTSIAEEL